jgi:hypothetical protein
MKKIVLCLVISLCVAATACKARYGCRGNGRNVGAEKLISGDAKAMKDAKRAGKFKH